MSLYSLIQYILLFLLILLPILWQLSSQFRYCAKAAILYFLVLLTSFIAFFLVIWRPGNPENYHLVYATFHLLTRWCNFKWEVRGKEHLEDLTPAVCVMNHQSAIDMHGMGFMWPKRGVALAKKSLMYAGTFGISAKLSGTVFIDRFSAEAARKTMDEAVETVKQKNLKLFVFAEGTRYHGEDGMLPFKKGAFHVAVQGQFPIVPVVFSSYRFFYSKKEYKWLPTGFGIIEILPPISTVGLKTEDVTELCETTRNAMVQTWNRITSEAEEKYNSGNY